jgi:hypothetical protein
MVSSSVPDSYVLLRVSLLGGENDICHVLVDKYVFLCPPAELQILFGALRVCETEISSSATCTKNHAASGH